MTSTRPSRTLRDAMFLQGLRYRCPRGGGCITGNHRCVNFFINTVSTRAERLTRRYVCGGYPRIVCLHGRLYIGLIGSVMTITGVARE